MLFVDAVIVLLAILIDVRKGGVAHRLRRRRQRLGELIQNDGSLHHWFGEKRSACCLIAFIDDATSVITEAYFCESENTEAYLHYIEHHLIKYGVPVVFYSDRHSIFDVNRPPKLQQFT